MAKTKKHIKKISTSKGHVSKTRSEVVDYIDKVKSSSPVGSTDGSGQKKDSNMSLGGDAVSGHPQTASYERNRIPVPQEEKISVLKIVGLVATVISIIVAIIIFTRWITNLEGKIESNTNSITKIDTTVANYAVTELDIKERLARLEVWRDTFAKRLSSIEDDLQKGVPISEIDRRVSKIESEVQMLIKNQHNKSDLK